MSRIVQSAGIAVGRHGERDERTTRIEAAMVAAVEKAAADGITDVDEIRVLILDARDKEIG